MGAPTRPKPRVEEWESEAPAELAPPRFGRSVTLQTMNPKYENKIGCYRWNKPTWT